MPAKIHYRNEPYTALVESLGETVELTPIVYDEDFNCGLGVVYPDGKGQIWGMVSPRDLIAAWRGTEILRHLPSIKNGTLHMAYTAALRDPRESDRKYVDEAIMEIGQEAYDRIMTIAVPEEIIQAIIDGQDDDFSPSLYPITEEVRAATVEWRQEFADLGVEHPFDKDAKAELAERTIGKFEALLDSYSQYRGLPRHCLGMNHVDGAVLTLVLDRKAEIPDELLVALAGVVGELATSEFAMFISPFGGATSQEEHNRILTSAKEKALSDASEWLMNVFNPPPLPRRGRRKALAARKAKELEINAEAYKAKLLQLLEQYFPTKEETS